MPRLFVVNDETKQEKALTAALLRAQLTKGQAAEALAELEALNPGVDLSRLRSGQVLVVPDAAGFKPSASEPLRKESFDAFAALARASLEQLVERRKAERVGRDAEREEVARALKVALKVDPKLRGELEKVVKALKRDDKQDGDDEQQLEKSVKEGLAELTELAERHFR